MTLFELLKDVAFASPVTVEDCAQLRDALREHYPKALIDVYCHKGTEVVVNVTLNGIVGSTTIPVT